MPSNREIITEAFQAWRDGSSHVSRLFAPDLQWEIVGRSVLAKKYTSARQFTDEVLRPFGARFEPGTRLRPTTIRAVYADDDQHTVVVIWDGEGTTTAGTTYRNTYAWFMTLDGGRIVRGTAFFDTVAFNELWFS
jgi:ketosteroid isomerase-like protein